jgi:hypothetical protein
MMDTIVRWLKRLGLGGGLAIALIYVVFCAYSLPSHMKVHVTGIEIKRQDVEKKDGTVRSQDVWYVMTEDLDGEAHMFRNQDTGWGWPPYFKFNSGDIAAQANNLASQDSQSVVLVKYYGFRIRLLSAYPNVLSMRVVPPDYQPIPWFTIFFVFAHLVAIGFVWTVVRSFREGREGEL